MSISCANPPKEKETFLAVDYNNEDWETVPNNSMKAFEFFNKEESCPILSQVEELK